MYASVLILFYILRLFLHIYSWISIMFNLLFYVTNHKLLPRTRTIFNIMTTNFNKILIVILLIYYSLSY